MQDVVGFAECRPPHALAQSLVLSRLATGTPLLPATIAQLISALSQAARVTLRSAALIIEQVLESVRLGTMVGMGLTRRALIAAVASARTMHYVAQGLEYGGKEDWGHEAAGGGLFLSVLDHYTNVGVYVITHVFTLAELFSMAGLSLTASITSLGFTAAEESVRIFDGLLGSGESSRALSSIIALVRKELADDPAFHHISSQGVIATLTALTKTLTCFVCLQAATSKRTAKEMKLRVVYDCTVVDERQATFQEQEEEEEEADSHLSAAQRRRPRAPSVDLLISDIPDDYAPSTGRHPRIARSRQTSSDPDAIDFDERESTEIVRELTQLCGDDGSDEGDELSDEVHKALRELQQGVEGQRGMPRGVGADYEIEVSETTTTTTTIVRTTDPLPAASSAASAVPQSNRTRPPSFLQLTEGDDDEMEEEDDWVELDGSRGVQRPSENYEMLPSDINGRSGLAAQARQESLEHPTESQQRLQVVLRTMTSQITKKTQTLRRVGARPQPPPAPHGTASSASRVPESTPRPRSAKAQKRGSLPDWSNEPTETETTQPSRDKGKGVLRALGKALKKTNSIDASSFLPGRSSRSSPSSRDKTPPATPSFLSPPPSPKLTPTLPSFSRAHSRQTSNASTYPDQSRRPSLAPERLSSMSPAPSSVPVPPHLRHASSIQSMRSSFITTCKHTASTASEEPEPKASNFPRRHLVDNLQRFMRFSSAAYGQAFLRVLGLGKSRGLDFTFPNTRSPANNHAFAHHVGIRVDDILLDTYTDNGIGVFDDAKIQPVVAYIAVDHEASAIVLSCRGSLGLSDILVDLTCSYESIHVPDGDPMEHYYVHSGMWHSATRMQRGTVHETIRQALIQYPSYGLVICGHSLGGGVAALLSIIWACPTSTFERNLASSTPGQRQHPPLHTPFVTSFTSGLPAGRPISCYAYGPPCVASVDLQRYCRGLVTSVVANNDVVPTLSLGTLRDLKTMAMNLHEDRHNGTTQEIIGRVVGLWQDRVAADKARRTGGGQVEPSLYDVSEEERMVALTRAEIVAGRGSNRALDPSYRDPSHSQPELSEELMVNDYLWAVMRTLRASNVNDKLYPPGDNFVVESYTVFIASESSQGQYSRREGSRILLRACDDVEKRFGEPIFSKSLFNDHSPSTYENHLDLLAKAVLHR